MTKGRSRATRSNTDEAKADYDTIVVGLIAALAQAGSLNDFRDRTQRAFEKREAFDKSCNAIPSIGGQKGVIDEIVTGALGPGIDAVKVIWVKRMDENALTRATIQTQLEATKWLPFDSVAHSS